MIDLFNDSGTPAGTILLAAGAYVTGTPVQTQGERIARIEGVLASAPQTAEFYELRGRVEEISRRLPATLAYQPQPPRQS